MRDEIDTVLGDRNEITYEDLSGLNYISCVIKETLRLWPPANGTVRKVDTDDFSINGLKIPKHTTVHVCIFSNTFFASIFTHICHLYLYLHSKKLKYTSLTVAMATSQLA